MDQADSGTDSDDGELERFCRAEYPRLVGLLSLYCGDVATAEDLAQETLARVWRKWSHVRALEEPGLWARRVGLNLATSWFRRRSALQRATSRLAARPSLAPDDPADLAGDDHLTSRLAALTPRQRTAVLLRFHDDLSVAETAHVMGCREGTVKALTSQAVAALRLRGTDDA